MGFEAGKLFLLQPSQQWPYTTCVNLEKFILPTLSNSLTITLLNSRDKCSEVLAAGSAYLHSSTKEMAGLQEIVRFFPSNGVQTRVFELRGMLGLGKDDITGLLEPVARRKKKADRWWFSA